MESALRTCFLQRWEKYFGRAEHPLAWFYSDDEEYSEFLQPKPARHEFFCLIGQLSRVRRGDVLTFSAETIGCPGGSRYAGFSKTLRPDFKYFLSCGIPGRMEGERYKKTPELVERLIRDVSVPPAEGKYLVFKSWPKFQEDETPQVVVFFVPPDALSGLFTLANFRHAGESGVVCPFGAGCGSIIGHPRAETLTADPRAVLGMFDPSARPHIEPDLLTLAVPWVKFLEMNEDMDESFLNTNTWEQLRRRLAGRKP